MSKFLTGVILYALFGAFLGMAGIGLVMWQFWAIVITAMCIEGNGKRK